MSFLAPQDELIPSQYPARIIKKKDMLKRGFSRLRGSVLLFNGPQHGSLVDLNQAVVSVPFRDLIEEFCIEFSMQDVKFRKVCGPR